MFFQKWKQVLLLVVFLFIRLDNSICLQKTCEGGKIFRQDHLLPGKTFNFHEVFHFIHYLSVFTATQSSTTPIQTTAFIFWTTPSLDNILANLGLDLDLVSHESVLLFSITLVCVCLFSDFSQKNHEHGIFFMIASYMLKQLCFRQIPVELREVLSGCNRHRPD